MRAARRWVVLGLFALAVAVGQSSKLPAAEPQVGFQQQPGRLVVTVQGKPVATYVYSDPEIPRPYFAHVRTADGVQVTRNHPPVEGRDASDHPTMHPGIWLAFGDLNGEDFWRNKAKIKHQRFLARPQGGPGKGTFVEQKHYVGRDGNVVCRERFQCTFHVRPSGTLIEWDSTFSADRPFTFGDQEEMGLGIRVATPMAGNNDGRLLDSQGRIGGKQVWGNAASWCDYGGVIGDRRLGMTILCHPDNFRPSWMHARDYGFVAANAFGRQAMRQGPASQVVVEPGQTLRLRYGILLHSGSKGTQPDFAAARADYVQLTRKPAAPPTQSGSAADKRLPGRPNVLFIAVDDLRVELGCYGNSPVKSPNIDGLAERSTLFERAYCQQAVCNPSRASLLTGMRPQALRIWDLPTHFRQRRPDIVTLPQLFKQHGYHTQNIGKIFHNWRQDDYQGDAPSWSVPAVLHYNSHGKDKAVVKGPLPPNLSDVPKCEIRDVPDEAYFDGRVAAGAVKAIGQLKDRPFFLAVGFWKPHAHFNAPKKYWDLYSRAEIKPPANPDPPRDVPALALHDAREMLRSFAQRPGGKPTPSDVLALRHGYYAATSYVDAQVGKVLDALDHHGLRDKTIVVLWSDHGYHLGEHGLWAKTSNFELDARVPLLISLPNQKQGQRTKALVELLDLYPTLADLAGLPAPHKLEGKSLRPVLDDPQATVKSAALTWHPRPAYPPGRQNPTSMGYSMRTDRYRYTEWRDFRSGRLLARELYDHDLDDDETVNKAGNQEYGAELKRLATQLQQGYPEWRFGG